MIGLAIDTTSEACSVALRDSHGNIAQRCAHAPRQHGELLLRWVEELLQAADLKPAQLDAVWVTQGPGSFTSLRLGFSVATALAFALDRPVVPVSSLLALAARCGDPDMAPAAATGSVASTTAMPTPMSGLVLATLDARLGEIYAAWYCCAATGKPELTLQGEEQLLKPAELAWPEQTAASVPVALGNGLLVDDARLLQRAQALGFHCQADCWPQARDLFALADIDSGQAAWEVQLPYLRKKVADKPSPQVPQAAPAQQSGSGHLTDGQ
ncbi:MAG: tRNA (adenosine(37)-N6)-threonylcarbamoyltransferase complex dimerization subunit type 1 TsaB [Gammaproteobacteria bacterium]|nr:tRNA (adenosine(37)-N6)-threonylcarbamoyltransferase complex dimerization subunit type 1 TsaB [Gammaproteobacteria bacterium]